MGERDDAVALVGADAAQPRGDPRGETRQALAVGMDQRAIVGVDDNEAESSAVTVETGGAGSVKEKNPFNSSNSQYAIVRVRSNFKKDYRVVSGIKIGVAGKVTQTEDVIPTTVQVLPGNRWVRLTAKEPLTIGDYALMEMLGPGEVNLSVWDFRIDPQGPDNKNALMPLQRSSTNDR